MCAQPCLLATMHAHNHACSLFTNGHVHELNEYSLTSHTERERGTERGPALVQSTKSCFSCHLYLFARTHTQKHTHAERGGGWRETGEKRDRERERERASEREIERERKRKRKRKKEREREKERKRERGGGINRARAREREHSRTRALYVGDVPSDTWGTIPIKLCGFSVDYSCCCCCYTVCPQKKIHK